VQPLRGDFAPVVAAQGSALSCNRRKRAEHPIAPMRSRAGSQELQPMLPVETIACPYCGEAIDLVIDDSVEQQEYVEDCSVCCRPINVTVSIDEDSGILVTGTADNDT
jgi:Cysteine-rich CPXCG